MYVSVIYGSTEKLRAWLNGPACCLANLSGTPTWKLFRGLYLFLTEQSCSRAEHVQSRRTTQLMIRTREVFESEQRPKKFETSKEWDGEREGERRRQAMLSLEYVLPWYEGTPRTCSRSRFCELACARCWVWPIAHQKWSPIVSVVFCHLPDRWIDHPPPYAPKKSKFNIIQFERMTRTKRYYNYKKLFIESSFRHQD